MINSAVPPVLAPIHKICEKKFSTVTLPNASFTEQIKPMSADSLSDLKSSVY